MISDGSFTILLVDDNENNLFVFRTLINKFIDYAQVIESDSGETALKILSQQSIDLVILDVQMPEMDGFETAQRIRAQKKTHWLPIVFLSAIFKSTEFKQKGFELGALDYLTKPIDAETLVDKIEVYLRFSAQMRKYNKFVEGKMEKRELKFKDACNKLEVYAEEQTAELVQTNQRLKEEIEEHKRTEIELQKARNVAEKTREIAESANHAKSQFIANMSHSIRTPLNAIIGYSEMLEEDLHHSVYDNALLDVKKVSESGKQLLALINDVLDISKIESGNVELSFETFELTNILNDVVSTIQPLVAKNSNTLIVDCAEAEGEMRTDLTKLYQILLNLLSNAAKFTEHGIINIKISREHLSDGEWVNFCISDTGAGMTEQQKQYLFKAFAPTETAEVIDPDFHRTGLGLMLTKELAAMMGGYITVTSELGEGSTFAVHLPAMIKVDRKNSIVTTLLSDDEQEIYADQRNLV